MSAFVIVRNSYLLLMLLLGTMDYFLLEIPLYFYVLPTFIFLCLIVVGSAKIQMNFFTKANNTLVTNKKVIALTFDDGPSPTYTPLVLKLLDQYKAKGSFFCIGENIEKHPVLTKEIHEKGHTLGNHTYSHSNIFPFFGKSQVVREIQKTNQWLFETTGIRCTLFRPPFGVTNPAIAKAIKACQMQTVGWSIRSFDTSTKDADKVIKRVISKIKPGAVILLHDDRPNTPKILEAILLYAQENGYQCIAVSPSNN